MTSVGWSSLYPAKASPGPQVLARILHGAHNPCGYESWLRRDGIWGYQWDIYIYTYGYVCIYIYIAIYIYIYTYKHKYTNIHIYMCTYIHIYIYIYIYIYYGNIIYIYIHTYIYYESYIYIIIDIYHRYVVCICIYLYFIILYIYTHICYNYIYTLNHFGNPYWPSSLFMHGWSVMGYEWGYNGRSTPYPIWVCLIIGDWRRFMAILMGKLMINE